jgi:hypothetical protein
MTETAKVEKTGTGTTPKRNTMDVTVWWMHMYKEIPAQWQDEQGKDEHGQNMVEYDEILGPKDRLGGGYKGFKVVNMEQVHKKVLNRFKRIAPDVAKKIVKMVTRGYSGCRMVGYELVDKEGHPLVYYHAAPLVNGRIQDSDIVWNGDIFNKVPIVENKPVLVEDKEEEKKDEKKVDIKVDTETQDKE